MAGSPQSGEPTYFNFATLPLQTTLQRLEHGDGDGDSDSDALLRCCTVAQWETERWRGIGWACRWLHFCVKECPSALRGYQTQQPCGEPWPQPTPDWPHSPPPSQPAPFLVCLACLAAWSCVTCSPAHALASRPKCTVFHLPSRFEFYSHRLPDRAENVSPFRSGSRISGDHIGRFVEILGRSCRKRLRSFSATNETIATHLATLTLFGPFTTTHLHTHHRTHRCHVPSSILTARARYHGTTTPLRHRCRRILPSASALQRWASFLADA